MRVALVCRGCDAVYPLDLPDGVQLGRESVTMALECCEGAAIAIRPDKCPRCKGEGRYARKGSERVDVCDWCGGTGRRTEGKPVQTLPFVPVGKHDPIGDDDIPF